jgi:hypothetical protein
MFLRVGDELDNPSFTYSNPPLYRRAFQRLVEACEHERAEWSCVMSRQGEICLAFLGSRRQAVKLLLTRFTRETTWWTGSACPSFNKSFSNLSIQYVKQVLQFAADHDSRHTSRNLSCYGLKTRNCVWLTHFNTLSCIAYNDCRSTLPLEELLLGRSGFNQLLT